MWAQEVLNKLCLTPSKLIKKFSILYTVSREDMSQCHRRAIIQGDDVIRKLTKQSHEGNTGYLQGKGIREEFTALALIPTAFDSEDPTLQLPKTFASGHYCIC